MARTESKMLPLGTKAPDFKLPDTDGTIVSLDDYKNHRGLLVMFICNHCPFVKHIRTQLASLTKEYLEKKIGVVGINSNDSISYPEDGPEKMLEEKREQKYLFPYLFDESQRIALAYRAACTPDFYLFDQNLNLVYRGQLDESRPGNNSPVTGRDLRAAMDDLLAGQTVSPLQKPSLGCSIKWKSKDS